MANVNEQKCERGVCTTECACYGCFDTCATCLEPRCPVIHVKELLRRGNRKICMVGQSYPTKGVPPVAPDTTAKPEVKKASEPPVRQCDRKCSKKCPCYHCTYSCALCVEARCPAREEFKAKLHRS